MYRILDICSGAGLAAIGYHQAGFEVVGVDIKPQPRYPFQHICADALEILADVEFCRQFHAIHASPPCQAYSTATAQFRGKGKTYPNLIAPIRQRLKKIGIPYVIENVPGAPIRCDIALRGDMFSLKVIRRRHFEIGHWWAMQPGIPLKIGTAANADFISIFGKYGLRKNAKWPTDYKPTFWQGTGLATWHYAMGIPPQYKFRDVEISEGIPPAYSKYIGTLLLERIAILQNSENS